MATKITHWLNYPETGIEEEVNTMPSETQPDEVLTVRQMLDRHARGLPVRANDYGTYHDEEAGYVPEIESLDLTEVEDYIAELSERRKHLENEQKQKAKADADAAAVRKKEEEEMKEHFRKQKEVKKPPTD